MKKEIHLISPRGFCAGVTRAIDVVNIALEKYGPPVYVKHEIVHNKSVIEELKLKGAVFIEDIKDVPQGTPLIFSAHGVSKLVVNEANEKKAITIDATCPLVTKVHVQAKKFSSQGYHIFSIGHRNHPEVEGTVGQYQPKSGKGGMYIVESVEDVMKLKVKNPDFLAFVTQTTLSMDDTSEVIDALKTRFPNIDGPKKKDICYATQNRQDAVKSILNYCDYLLVIGSVNSSNSRRLVELALKNNIPSKLIDDTDDINLEELKDKRVIGITAGASAPEILLDQVTEFLMKRGAKLSEVKQDAIKENIIFSMPKELRNL